MTTMAPSSGRRRHRSRRTQSTEPTIPRTMRRQVVARRHLLRTIAYTALAIGIVEFRRGHLLQRMKRLVADGPAAVFGLESTSESSLLDSPSSASSSSSSMRRMNLDFDVGMESHPGQDTDTQDRTKDPENELYTAEKSGASPDRTSVPSTPPEWLGMEQYRKVTNEVCDKTDVSIPTLYDSRPDVQDHYKDTTLALTNHFNRFVDLDLPKIRTLHNASFVVHHSGKKSQAVAWTDDGETVEGPGWIRLDEIPKQFKQPVPTRVLKDGDYVAFTSWFEGNFGHYLDDHLPSIAYLRSIAPATTKFLLVDTPLARNVMDYLDPDFARERIVWIQIRECVRVEGSMTVAIPHSIPLMHGQGRGHVYLRKWINEHHPYNPDTPKQVVYYSRGSADTHHSRKVDPEHEEKVLETIRAKMQQHGKEERLVVFNGLDKDPSGTNNTKTMSISKQASIFRSASTIIGPHGAGMLGNLIWVNPFPTDCQQRPKTLEFVPGQESEHVQSLYRSMFIRWRHWPVDFGVILYTKESTHDTTYVDLHELELALDAMWGPKEPTQQTSNAHGDSPRTNGLRGESTKVE